MLRDITQAYTQSATELTRDVYIRLPVELKDRYPEGTVLKVMKPLYGLAEAGAHWYQTYVSHHKDNLGMTYSPYDPCFLITKEGEAFGMTGMQTDDTLNLGSVEFMQKEQRELERAKFKAKPPITLEEGSTEDFNSCRIHIKADGTIKITQKG